MLATSAVREVVHVSGKRLMFPCNNGSQNVWALQVISEALLSLSAEEADGTFATVYMPIVVEGHKR